MMPPLFVVLNVVQRGRRIRLWIPLFLFWILLLPLLLVLLPFAVLALLAMDLSPHRSIGAMLGVLGSLRGTSIDIAQADSNVFIRIV